MEKGNRCKRPKRKVRKGTAKYGNRCKRHKREGRKGTAGSLHKKKKERHGENFTQRNYERHGEKWKKKIAENGTEEKKWKARQKFYTQEFMKGTAEYRKGKLLKTAQNKSKKRHGEIWISLQTAEKKRKRRHGGKSMHTNYERHGDIWKREIAANGPKESKKRHGGKCTRIMKGTAKYGNRCKRHKREERKGTAEIPCTGIMKGTAKDEACIFLAVR